MHPTMRRATSDDRRFVLSSWLASFWSTWARRHVDRDTYYRHYPEQVRLYMDKAQVHVAFFEEVPDEILGWACVEGDVCHYVYVKSIYRKKGIARGLLPSETRWYSSPTDTLGGLVMKKCGLKFNPWRKE